MYLYFIIKRVQSEQIIVAEIKDSWRKYFTKIDK